MPQVSVILPNFNHAIYLDKRLESILHQTYQDFEIIILDDCSTDNSREIIEKYRSHDKVAKIIYNEINSGSTFRQWDKGILNASGRFIWIAESDDYCEPSFLSELVPALENDDSLVIAFCQSLFVLPGGKIVNKTEADQLVKKVNGEEFLRKYMLGVNAISNVSMAILRKSTIQTIAPDYKNFTYCGDWLFYSAMSLKGNVFISGKYLNYYLRHENSVTSNVTKKGLDFFEGNRVFDFIKNNIEVPSQDITAGLNKRINKYVELKGLIDQAEQKYVISSLMKLDPSMKGILKKRMFILSIRKVLSAIKRSLFSF